MPPAQAHNHARKAWLALGLAFTGGYVDAVGYVVLLQVFTAHMSGNSIAFGVHVGAQDWSAAFHRGFVIPLFVAGVFLGAVLAEVLVRRGMRSPFGAVFALEAILLLLFMSLEIWLFGGKPPENNSLLFCCLAAMPALAMGLQNATLRKVGGSAIRTTYISGLLTDTAEEAVRFLFWRCDCARGMQPDRLLWGKTEPPSLACAFLWLGMWTCYVGAAILGTVALLGWGLPCLLVPIGLLLVVVLADFIRPFTPAES